MSAPLAAHHPDAKARSRMLVETLRRAEQPAACVHDESHGEKDHVQHGAIQNVPRGNS
jgi:hypothetical protein